MFSQEISFLKTRGIRGKKFLKMRGIGGKKILKTRGIGGKKFLKMRSIGGKKFLKMRGIGGKKLQEYMLQKKCFLFRVISININTVELQWLEHLLNLENMFETGVV